MSIDKKITVIISAVDQYSGAMGAFSGGLKMAGVAAIGAEAAIIALSVAVAKLTIEMGVDAFNSARDFHDAIFDVTAVAKSMGTTSEQVSDILDGLVAKFPVTGKEAGDALEMIAQMGYGTEDQLKKVSDAALTLSIATGTDLQTAASATMATMNAFGLELDEVDRVTNLFAQTQFTSAASVSNLKESMKFAAVAGKQFGFDLEEVVAVQAKFRDIGLEASQSGTIFRMAMATLSKETNKGAAALKKYGMTYDDVNPATHSFVEILKAFEGVTLGAKDSIDLFGVRQMAMGEIVNQGAKGFEEYLETISGTTASVDAAEIKFQKWEVVLNNLGGSMDVLKKTIGEGLVPAMVDIVGVDENSGIRAIITKIMDLEKAQGAIGKPFLDALLAIKKVASNVFSEAFGDAEGFYNWLTKISGTLGKNVEILAIWAGEIAKLFVKSTDDSEGLVFALKVVNTAIGGLAIPIALIHDILAGLFYMGMIQFNALKSIGALFISEILEGLTDILKIANVISFGSLDDELKSIEAVTKKIKEQIQNPFDIAPPKIWSGAVVDALVKSNDAIDEFGENLKNKQGIVLEQSKEIVGTTETSAENVKAMSDAMDKTAKAAEGAKEQIKQMDPYTRQQGETLQQWADRMSDFDDKTKAAADSVKKTGKEIENVDKKLSEMEKYELKLETAVFEQDLKVELQTIAHAHTMAEENLKWKAQIDIAEAEASATVLAAAFESTGEEISSISESLASMFESFNSFKGTKSERWDMMDMMEEASKSQKDLADAQIDLIEAQIELLAAQKAKIESKDPVPIEVTVAGPSNEWIRGLTQELFEEIMVQAKLEAFNCICTGGI